MILIQMYKKCKLGHEWHLARKQKRPSRLYRDGLLTDIIWSGEILQQAFLLEKLFGFQEKIHILCALVNERIIDLLVG